MKHIFYLLFDDIITNYSFAEFEDFIEKNISLIKDYHAKQILNAIKCLCKKYKFDVNTIQLLFEVGD